jgi:4-amino-4-deoxy-L-arabinose transferase-like glycosyltransferase
LRDAVAVARRFEVPSTVVLALALFLAGGTSLAPLPGDEARFVQAAREMRARGEWVVPTVGGVPRYDKPILSYWLLAGSHALLGESAMAARLPSNLAAALTVGLIARWSRRRWGAGAGALAGGLLAATFLFHVEAKAATADAVMVLATVAALLAFARLWRGEAGRGAQLQLWISLGVGALAKGPVAPAVVITTAIAIWGLGRPWSRWELGGLGVLLAVGWGWLGPAVLLAPLVYALGRVLRDPAGRQGLARLGAPWGVPLAAAVVAPWAVAAFAATGGEYLAVGIGRHVVTRARVALEGHGGFPGWYVVTGFAAAFPWFALLGPALRGRLARLRVDPESRFLVAWLVGPLILFELARTKLGHYWLPSYPAGVLLVTAWLYAPPGGRDPAAPGAVAVWLTVIPGLLLGVAPAAAAAHFGLDEIVRPALLAALPLVVGLLVFARLARARTRRAVAALALGAVLHVAALAGGAVARLSEHTVERRAARVLRAAAAPEAALVTYRVRAADALVALPAGTTACREPECLRRLLTRRTPVAGVASPAGFAELRRRAPDLRLQRVAGVTGLDVVHGGREGWVVFRSP